jgi:5-methylcytosine-specific restriction endonuclease McrA
MAQGYGRAWGKIARAVMARDSWTCRSGGAPAEEVDHIIPRAVGGPDTVENAWSLCAHCHRIRPSSTDRAAWTVP